MLTRVADLRYGSGWASIRYSLELPKFHRTPGASTDPGSVYRGSAYLNKVIDEIDQNIVKYVFMAGKIGWAGNN